MHNENYGLEQYIADLREIFSSESDEKIITTRVKPLAKRLAAEKGWFKDEYRETEPSQGFGVHLLHEEENHDLGVFVFAWEPGKGVGAHNHNTWVVVAGIEGQEHEIRYDRLDDGSTPGYADLREAGDDVLGPGQVVSCGYDDIHGVWNRGDVISVSLHTYGRHLNHTNRSVFDVAAKTEEPLIVKVEDQQ